MESFQDIIKNYNHLENESMGVLTKFEKCKLIGTRMEQLARGSTPLVDTIGLKTIREIAFKELEEKKMPFLISRKHSKKPPRLKENVREPYT